MKQLNMAFVFLFFSSLSCAQSLSPKVYASSGGFFIQSNGALSWTLGEVESSSYVKTTVTLTQGFQQHFLLNTSENEVIDNSEIRIFPNPFLEFVFIETDNISETYISEIFNNTGIKLISQEFDKERSILKTDQLSAGIYLLKITNKKSQVLKTLKIVKL